MVTELKERMIDNRKKQKGVVERQHYSRATVEREIPPYVSKVPVNTPGDAWSYRPSSLSSHAKAFHAQNNTAEVTNMVS